MKTELYCRAECRGLIQEACGSAAAGLLLSKLPFSG